MEASCFTFASSSLRRSKASASFRAIKKSPLKMTQTGRG
jgi:hypothetical protein